jgi:hypothetical protein
LDGYTTYPYYGLDLSMSGYATTTYDTTNSQPSLIWRHLPQRLYLRRSAFSCVFHSCITITYHIYDIYRHTLSANTRVPATHLHQSFSSIILRHSILGTGAPTHFSFVYLQRNSLCFVVLSRLVRIKHRPTSLARKIYWCCGHLLSRIPTGVLALMVF